MGCRSAEQGSVSHCSEYVGNVHVHSHAKRVPLVEIKDKTLIRSSVGRPELVRASAEAKLYFQA